jgi:hypothetical protein
MPSVHGQVGPAGTQVGWVPFNPENKARNFPDIPADNYLFLTTSQPSDEDPAAGRIHLEGHEKAKIVVEYSSYNQDATRGYCWWLCGVTGITQDMLASWMSAKS